ncbi:single-stranded DNA-binding protein [Limosilactobacillus reuteri]|jgi:single-strand DNA-binding protein|uniref:Single-stranded DNA-binding protein n=2 Tax=Limosilactobacillus reuteri TaxID=1598 RepID=A0A2T5Q1K6_LIMRT|nr:single-stranded DNA-binding protein [Limosilactobacillus reuteri]MCW3764564.1 single-stranded DNA-binding protein [Weissella confusa]MCC4414872.1 single-stranded DNA-binding protein [Limosilactobacillus reuteri]MCC4478095.1 single-stranded DNA-binding protein [Limosilactobacillus reuteri]MCC4480398.1 single-stranded DNA-binding protein [Limosilactobacillus reuteri]MCC4488494.1 single-stranded DNA-binding protein [Limosilactobacillus reuteri]
MNDIKLLGRLTQTPELKESVNGNQYAWFTVAVPRKNNRDEADFIRCKAFGKLASALKQHCDKGRQLLLTGRLEVSATIDQQTQQKRFFHTVIAHQVEFLHDPNRVAA